MREPTTEWVASHPGTRLIGEAFMEIRQAVAVPRSLDPAALAWLDGVVAQFASR